MNIWEIDKSLLFMVLVLPGFISIKIYSLLVATENRDYSKSLVEAICYSVLNFTALSWLIVIVSEKDFLVEHPNLYWLYIALIFIVIPALWPFLFLWLSSFKVFKKNMLSLYKQPWDYVFNKREAMWVVIHLKDGEIIRGKYANKSFASSYPAERQIYLEELWKENDGKLFGKKVNRTKGVIVSQDEIKYIKFIGQ